MEMINVRLLPDALDSVSAFAEFSAQCAMSGAVVSFTGKVRPVDKMGSRVDHLYLDWYPGMTEASMSEIACAAYKRFDVERIMVLHRAGKVDAGEDIVFIAAASAHRRAAFEAADYLMDRLKSEAAFWKREHGPDAEKWPDATRWIEPTVADQADKKRWENG